MAIKKISSKRTQTPAKIVKAKPAAKIVEKGRLKQEIPKLKVKLLKKVQTAEGWKREQVQENQVKKRSSK